MEDCIYKLADGRLWDTAKADWTDDKPGGDVICLVSAEGVSDEAYLARTLAFYHYPLGELAGGEAEANPGYAQTETF